VRLVGQLLPLVVVRESQHPEEVHVNLYQVVRLVSRLPPLVVVRESQHPVEVHVILWEQGWELKEQQMLVFLAQWHQMFHLHADWRTDLA